MPADGASDFERAVLGCITRVGTVTGDPVGVICRQLGLSGSAARQRVNDALSALSREGKIDVQRDKGVVVRVASVASRPPGWRPETSEGRRQAVYARGVPSRLRDDQCSPVEVTKVSPEEARRRARGEAYEPAPELVYRDDAPYHENLTVCLTALRQVANEQGIGERLSVRSVLLELVDNMTERKADRAMEYLRSMGLYTTTPVGYRKRNYTVDMAVPQVSAEMVEDYRASKRAPTRTSSDEAANTAVDPAQTDLPSDGISRLVEIIEQLEARLAEKDGVIERLTAELSAARAELARRPSLDQRVQGVLARYKRG